MIPTFWAGPGGLKPSGAARATALAGRSNSSRFGPRKIVFTDCPSTRTNDVVVNPLPSSTTRTPHDPSCTFIGWIALIVGAAFDATIGRARCVSVTYSG